MNYRHIPESRPLPGYTIKRGVGRGAFGEVYYAVSDGGKEVALKLVQNHVEVELRGVKECLNFDHPNLVRLYDVQRNDAGETWVVMEYCDGESLEEAVARHPDGMPSDVAVQWMRGVCEAVAYLHKQDVVHRDLKPSHVFMENGVVKIGDYGLAKFLSISRRSGNTEGIGTVYYVAPEMADGRYGKEIDQYALGVMFYEMLCGDVPFDGETAAEVLMKHLTAKPNVARFPSPYREIVGKLLEKKPERRFGSVRELVAALDAPVSAGGPDFPTPPGKDWVRSKLAKVQEAVRPKALLKRVGGFIGRHKAATVVFVLLTAGAFAIGAAIVEESWRRHRGYPHHYRPQHLSIQNLSDLHVKRGDGNGTIRLSHVASFTSPNEMQKLSPRRPIYAVVLHEPSAKRAGVDRSAVMEALWDAGYSLVLDFELKSRVHGIDEHDLRRQIYEAMQVNEHRRQQCRAVRYDDHAVVQVSRNRRVRQSQVEFFLMNLHELFDVSIEKDGKIVPIEEVAEIRILASNPF